MIFLAQLIRASAEKTRGFERKSLDLCALKHISSSAFLSFSPVLFAVEGLMLSSWLVSWLPELMAGCLVSGVTDTLAGKVVARRCQANWDHQAGELGPPWLKQILAHRRPYSVDSVWMLASFFLAFCLDDSITTENSFVDPNQLHSTVTSAQQTPTHLCPKSTFKLFNKCPPCLFYIISKIWLRLYLPLQSNACPEWSTGHSMSKNPLQL